MLSRQVAFVPEPAVTKGAGTDAAQIAALLDVAYDSARGSFDVP
jgi:hypothetical protein